MLGDCTAPVASHGLDAIALEGLGLPLEARRGESTFTLLSRVID